MSVRIVSDGTTPGTAIQVDGEPLDGVLSVSWWIDSEGIGKAVITVDNVAVNIRADEVRMRNVGDEQ